MDPIRSVLYIISAILFILGIKQLSKASTARRGNATSSLGMLLGIIATLLKGGFQYQWIIVGAVAGALVGILASRLVKMTGMPEMVALFNGFGGLASLLVGWGTYQAIVAKANVSWDILATDSYKFLSDLGGTFSSATIYQYILACYTQ